MARATTRTFVPLGALTVLVAVAVVASTAGSAGGGPGGTGGSRGTDLGGVEAASLSTFSSCDALLDHIKTEATRLVGPYGLPGSGYSFPVAMAAERATRDTAGGGAPSGAGSSTSAQATGSDAAGTGTNVQVAGVDEADIAKVVGGRLLTLTDGVLRVSSLDGERPHVLAALTVEDWMPGQLLVTGDRVLLIGSGGAMPMADLAVGSSSDARLVGPDVMPWSAGTRLAEVDLSDPASPAVRTVVDVDGTVVGARLVDGTATLALSSPAGRLPWVMPMGGDGSADDPAARRATQANKDLIAESTLTDWLPSSTEGGQTRPLLDCADVAAPEEFAGLDTLTLMSIDLAGGGLAQWDTTGVLASGSTLYATAEHTYVATSLWQDWAALDPAASVRAVEHQRTQIHLFATAPQDAPRYVASTQVPGFLLGQFAMDEYDGTLRVASTTQPPFAFPVPALEGEPPSEGSSSTVAPDVQPGPPPSQSRVTTFSVGDAALERLGAVTGLGVTETIRGVRFLGEVGYVVTFRQTDPLYTIDLSDPAAPRVAGELKILGYSAYLHPAGDGLLLGLGQDATTQGRTLGLQLSLFDVSDPANPRRVDQVRVDGAWSDVEGDHHAFTFVDGLALAPYQLWGELVPAPDVPGGSTVPGTGATKPAPYLQTFDAGVLAVRVQDGALSKPSTLRPVADGPITADLSTAMPTDDVVAAVPLRTVVVDGVVYTVTPRGIAAHDADSLRRIAFSRF